jgi:spermidine/putrescine transport system ATP-binding protein
MALIELKDITKEFGGNIVLKGINLTIEENEFVTLLGPSGCGKTTTLRIIGGFIDPSSGEVLFEGESILGTPAHKRPTNTVFQRYALFPHLDVFENVAFGLRVKVESNQQRREINKLNKEYNEKIKILKNKPILNEEDTELISEDILKLKKELKEKVYFLKNRNATKILEIRKLKEAKKKASKNEIEKIDIEISKIKSTFITKRKIEIEIANKVKKYLELVGLSGFETRSIHKLSGGQMQRVAIARALINEPRVLLLDEPLAALDLKLRQEMQYELKEIQRNAGITFIYVTHDQEEALTMSDKIVVMNQGEIYQIGKPEDIYNEPISEFVANFIGESNIIEGIFLDDYLVSFDNNVYSCIDKGFYKDEVVDIVIRPEDIDIVPKDLGLLTGVVDSIAFKGVHYEIDVKCEKRVFTVHTTDYHALGKEVDIKFGPDDLHVMEKW